MWMESKIFGEMIESGCRKPNLMVGGRLVSGLGRPLHGHVEFAARV